jgi:hypothetical protein
MLYATKRNLDMEKKQIYMDLSTSTGLEIWINEGRLVDMCSRCLVEKLDG